jgi:hypothetical protein
LTCIRIFLLCYLFRAPNAAHSPHARTRPKHASEAWCALPHHKVASWISKQPKRGAPGGYTKLRLKLGPSRAAELYRSKPLVLQSTCLQRLPVSVCFKAFTPALMFGIVGRTCLSARVKMAGLFASWYAYDIADMPFYHGSLQRTVETMLDWNLCRLRRSRGHIKAHKKHKR